ncbi:MAG: hypothetical protein A4E55_01628 [Pelotomaculum sp. PtaU1.Bin035]|nr:MAG: hypothetical protein A4E55_01628 [Pelotomaculum sp. PtaU1.Bin035]
MRMDFWRGVITGSIVGAALSMMAGGKSVRERKGCLGLSSRHAGSRAYKTIRGMFKNS